jgi:hypothetical protein
LKNLANLHTLLEKTISSEVFLPNTAFWECFRAFPDIDRSVGKKGVFVRLQAVSSGKPALSTSIFPKEA